MQPCYEDKFEAVLLCSMVGDALGAPVEGWSASRIAATHGKVDHFLAGQHMGLRGPGFMTRTGMYTDDMNSTLALADSIVRCRGVDANDAAVTNAEYALYYDEEDEGKEQATGANEECEEQAEQQRRLPRLEAGAVDAELAAELDAPRGRAHLDLWRALRGWPSPGTACHLRV